METIKTTSSTTVRIKTLVKGLILIYFFLSSRAILGLYFEVTGNITDIEKGNIIYQIIWLFYYVLFATLVVNKWEQIYQFFWKNKAFLALIVLPLVSVFWSDEPGLTLRRFIGLAGSTMIFLYAACHLPRKELWNLLTIYFGIAAILSIMTILILPESVGKMDDTIYYAWRGIYPHKNLFGRLMALGAAIFLIQFYNVKNQKFIMLTMYGLCGFLVWMSQSAGGIVIFILLTGFILVYPNLQFKSYVGALIAFITLTAGIAIASYVIINLQTILLYLGKDATLTGRTTLWILCWNLIQDNFFLGYGYNSFWLGWNGPSKYVWQYSFWMPAHAHNGFMDLWLDLGLIGLSLYLISILNAFIKAKSIFNKQQVQSILPLILLLFVFISNTIESFVLNQNDFQWGIFVITLFVLTSNTKSSTQDEFNVGV